MGRTKSNRNYGQNVDTRYKRQQKLLNQIAEELGVVAYRPDYHAQDRDCNTVLFYTKEDAEFNRDLEIIGDSFTPYKQQFWWFQNTDKNGWYDLDFANHGTIDLRPLDTYNILRQQIEKALAKHTGGSK